MERRTFVRTALGGAAGTATFGTASAADAFDGARDPLDGIEILTDDYQESHVYADDLYSLGYGNGYVQAGDRLFQMDVVRHVGYGNSAKVLGPAQIPSDIQVKRDLYSREEIRRQWESASETIRTVVRGFADGVNRRMTEMAAKGNLPAEFAALGHAPEPWKPEDTVAAINYLIGYFGVGGGDELSNAGTLYRLKQNLGSWRAAFDAYGDLNWLETADDHYTSIPEEDLTVDGGETVPDSWDDVPATQKRFLDAADPDAIETWGIEADLTLPDDLRNGEIAGQGIMEGFKWGSNALVVSPELSESGEPLLGGGPQMGYFKPPIPYEIGLHGAGFDISGIGVTGAPAVVIGRTAGGDDADALAWTVTSGRDDMVDTIAVELDPEDRHRYRWNGEWYEMRTHTVEHVANPAAAALTGDVGTRVVKQEVARVEQDGDVMPVVAWNPEENVAWVQRKTTRYDELAGAFQWAATGRADDLDDFTDAIAEFPFTFNFHVVSESGDVGYYHTGKVPERADGQDYRLPRSSADHAWYGTTTGLGLGTYVENPSRGYVVNWNNGPAKGWRAGDAEQNWGSIHRVEELDRFVRSKLGFDRPGATPVEAADPIDVGDVREIIMLAALHDATAYESAPVFADAASGADDDRVREMGRLLREWADDDCDWFDRAGDGVPYTDGDDRYDHPGHAIYDEVRSLLQREVFDVTTPPGEDGGGIQWDPPVSRHAGEHGTAWSDVTFVDALSGDTSFDWFDGRRDELVREALSTAADELEARFGTPEPTQWLEPVHKSRFLSLGAAPATSMDMRNRASYNQAIDLADAGSDAEDEWTAAARDVMPPGNSGLLTADEAARAQATGSGPERLTNQMAPYVRNTYKPHPATREQVEQVATTRKTVRPAKRALSGPVGAGDLPDGVDATVGDAADVADSDLHDGNGDAENAAETNADSVSGTTDGGDASEAVPGTDDLL